MNLNHKVMTLGPVEIEDEILSFGAKRMVYNRTEEFSKWIKGINKNLKYIFQTKNDVMILASSGTGAMETAIVNTLSEKDEVLIANNGTFGERLVKICSIYNLKVKEIKGEFGKQINPNKIKENLTKDTKAVLITANETSSCTLSDIEAIGKTVQNTNAILIVDAVSCLGCDEFKTDEWHCDVVFASANKGIGIPPGMAFITFSDKAWKMVEKSTLPKFYFDIKEYKKDIIRGQTPFTPPISLLFQLDRRLKKIKEKTIESIIDKNKKLSKQLREGISKLGLSLTSDNLSNGATGVVFPEGIDAKEIVDMMLAEHNIAVMPTPPPREHKMLRVGILGNINESDVGEFIKALERCLIKIQKRDNLLTPSKNR